MEFTEAPYMLIAPEEALRIVLSTVRPLRPGRVALDRAVGMYLAEDIRCDRDQPPADRSAMDGYAVAAADVRTAPARLRLVGEVAAGSSARPRVQRGCCAGILTGGNVPPGADAVVPVEHTEPDGQFVVVRVAARPGEHIRRRGEEARRGAVLLHKGVRLGAAEAGVCATVGAAEPKVFARPRVAVLCTGAELRGVAERPAAHELRDSNGPALLAALAGRGYGDAVHVRVTDDPRAIAARLRAALRTRDVAIVTGGVSVGQYDYVPEAVERVGAAIRFHGVNMKPGRPQLYATLGRGRHIFGLPGNPVSVLTGFGELVLPALRRLSGAPVEACRPAWTVRLAGPARSRGQRVRFRLARLIATSDGPAAEVVDSTGSADIFAACGADGLVVIPAGVAELPAGSAVEFHAWRDAL